MAFSQITSAEVAKNKPHTDTLGIKFKNNFDAHEDRLNAASGSKNSIPLAAVDFASAIAGSHINLRVTIVTGATTFGDHIIIIGDTSGGIFTLTLPDAGTNIGVLYGAVRKGASNLTIDTTGADTVEGGATVILVDDEMSWWFSDGVSDWIRAMSNIT